MQIHKGKGAASLAHYRGVPSQHFLSRENSPQRVGYSRATKQWTHTSPENTDRFFAGTGVVSSRYLEAEAIEIWLNPLLAQRPEMGLGVVGPFCLNLGRPSLRSAPLSTQRRGGRYEGAATGPHLDDWLPSRKLPAESRCYW